MSTIMCPSCGASTSGRQFCTACGATTGSQMSSRPAAQTRTSTACPKCGNVGTQSTKFCEKCGARLYASATASAGGPVRSISRSAKFPSAPTRPVTRCPNCGTTAKGNLKFCIACGKPLQPREEALTVGTAVGRSQEPDHGVMRWTRAPAGRMSHDEQTRRAGRADLEMSRPRFNTKSKGAMVAAGVVLVLMLAGTGWYFWGVETVIVCSPTDVKVTLDGNRIVPDSPGRFTVSHLARRRHTLRIQRVGYLDSIQTLDFPLSSLNEWVNVRLIPNASTSPQGTAPAQRSQ